MGCVLQGKNHMHMADAELRVFHMHRPRRCRRFRPRQSVYLKHSQTGIINLFAVSGYWRRFSCCGFQVKILTIYE